MAQDRDRILDLAPGVGAACVRQEAANGGEGAEDEHADLRAHHLRSGVPLRLGLWQDGLAAHTVSERKEDLQHHQQD
eukprot:CAMPEP_0119175436 /NCGR_PEP_ID=MMETSP1315-20130426/42047_1 /TAXON_ID=676789 /ORGANISM="Prasinoderma singularis, Strain RCC927" /LENGTH=76 /DNA_ID=CAMNT_0007169499 /DNA_START=18 /DNA_END=248 /DNA_ORIENTATION=-